MTSTSRSVRVARALLLAVVVLGLLYAWDQSRQPAAGTNWSLLGYRRIIGTPPSVRVISTPADLASAWGDFLIPSDPSSVDLDKTLVVWFSNFGTQGCPSRLDGVSIDRAQRIVAATFSRGFTFGCDAQQVPDSFLVQIDRSLLPSAPFTITMVDPQAAGAIAAQATVP
jgi:hypothetical protein